MVKLIQQSGHRQIEEKCDLEYVNSDTNMA